MKTICPYCKQEFPDTPDNYQGMSLECSVCGKEFVCEKAKICSACGAACSAKALKCVQCGTFFLEAPQPRRSPLSQHRPQEPSSFQPAGRQNASYDADSDPTGSDDCYEEDVNMLTPWLKLNQFSGRSCRKEFGFFLLELIIIRVVGLCVFCVVLGRQAALSYLILDAVLAILPIPAMVRRLHDMGWSGWWLLLDYSIPSIWITLLVWPSHPGENEWGLNPVGKPSPYVEKESLSIRALYTLGIIILAIELLTLVPIVLQKVHDDHAERKVTQKKACRSQLQGLGYSIRLYKAVDKRSELPPDPQFEHKKWRCPITGKSFIYLGNGLGDSNIDSIPIAMDNPSGHGEDVCILYGNGRINEHKLSHEMKNCVDVLNELHPELCESRNGRTVLENAKKADESTSSKPSRSSRWW